jgi:hypothetical protein
MMINVYASARLIASTFAEYHPSSLSRNRISLITKMPNNRLGRVKSHIHKQ